MPIQAYWATFLAEAELALLWEVGFMNESMPDVVQLLCVIAAAFYLLDAGNGSAESGWST